MFCSALLDRDRYFSLKELSERKDRCIRTACIFRLETCHFVIYVAAKVDKTGKYFFKLLPDM